MEKILKKIKIFIVILMVVLISVIAFVGVFRKDKGMWENVIPDYKYGMDIEGARELKYALDATEEQKYVYVDENGNVMGEVWKDGAPTTAEDEVSSDTEGQAENENTEEITYAKEAKTVKANEDYVLTKENFEQSKKIIQKRLENQNVGQYNLRLDNVTGNIQVETNNDNENINLIQDLVGQPGKFKIVDYQNGLELMDNSDIKSVSVVSSNQSEYTAYLQIEFDKEGAQKLKDISNKYVEIVEEKAESEETEVEATEEKTIKYVSIIFDDTTMMTTYFGEEMSAGILQINVGNATTDYDEFYKNYKSAQVIANILNSGVLPINYELETDNFVKSDFNKEIIKISVIAVVGIISVIFIIRFKVKGMIASVLSIGYIAALSIISRYTNVIITQNALIVAIAMILMNQIFILMFLKKLESSDVVIAYIDTMKKFYLNIIPVIIVMLVFTLNSHITISSMGMVAFWGLLISAVYNFVFTRTVFINIKNK